MIIRIVFNRPLMRMSLGDSVLTGLTPDAACIFPFVFIVSGRVGSTSLVLKRGFGLKVEEKRIVFADNQSFWTAVRKEMIHHVEDLDTEQRLYPETKTAP